MPGLVPPVLPPGHLAGRPQPVLVADELVLRPWDDGDAPAVVAAYADPDIQRWNLRRMDDLDEARAWIRSWRERWQAETDGGWAVVDGDGDLVGRVGLRMVELAAATAELTYWVVPAARGRRVATRSTDAVARWLLAEGFVRLRIAHSVHNTASCRVASAAGFAPEGIERSALLHTDGWHDMHAHARTRDDEAGAPCPT